MSKANLLGKMLSYSPAVIIPAALQFVTVIVFTHLVAAEPYGRYSLVMVTVQFLDVALFAWLRMGEMRFQAAAPADGGGRALYANTQTVLLALMAAILGIGVPGVLWLVPDHGLALALVSGLVLLVLRAGLSQALVRHRIAGQAARYSLIEIGRSSLTLVVPAVLVLVFGLREQALLIGAIAVFAVILLADLRSAAVRFSPFAIDGATTRTCLRFGLPAMLAVMLADLVAMSDRYVIAWFWGEGPVGIYSVASNIARQSIALLFTVTLVAAYPVLMQTMEREGPEAASRRLRENFGIVLALCIPATAGLALVAEPVATVFLGEAYREAGALMPWMALAAFLSGLKIHAYDHVFHLTKRTGLQLALNVPIAVANVALNLLLIPAWGVRGALAATIASYGLGLALTILATARLMPVMVPWNTVWRAMLATAAMAAVLMLPSYPDGGAGLALRVVGGGAVYLAAGVALNLLGVRAMLAARLGRLARARHLESPSLDAPESGGA